MIVLSNMDAMVLSWHDHVHGIIKLTDELHSFKNIFQKNFQNFWKQYLALAEKFAIGFTALSVFLSRKQLQCSIKFSVLFEKQ